MKIKKIVIVVCVLMVSCLLINLVSYADTVNPLYLGTYRDKDNSNAHITTEKTCVYLITFYYSGGTYFNAYVEDYTLTDKSFIAVCYDVRECTEDGTPLDILDGQYIAQGNVNIKFTIPRITTKRGNHVYIREY